jgi:biotin-dependent carboxylase-like uncharacterized protein
MLEVLATGPIASIQDQGRRGYQQLGIPRSGALDRAALDRGNLLVGNAPSAAGLELSLGRFRALFHEPAIVAVTGAPAPVSIDGQPAGFDVAQPVRAGQELRVGAPARGLHVYLAVSGGIDVAQVLGSRSTDTLSGLGPPPLRPGTRVPIGPRHGPLTVPPPPLPDRPAEVRVKFGPRDDWFADPHALTRNAYRLSTSNRIGARLDGPPLARAIPGELPSEGLIPGAVQVPGDGRPIVFLADHPATGGYPVIAVVHPDDLAFIAQARPGASVVFRGP